MKRKDFILFFLIFSSHLILRFYQMEQRNPFGWDQVDFAWISKNIIVDHNFPLVGVQAKLNSGIYIGPLYSYLTSFFYFFYNLDPAASGVLAGAVSIFSFLALFQITKKLFSLNVARIAIFLNAFSVFSISFDRTQWSVGLVPSLSLIIFFSLYKVLTGFSKYLVLLGISLGVMFHAHFTAVYFIFIILLSIPFFPKTKKVLKHGLIGFILFVIFLIPTFIFLFGNPQHGTNVLSYGSDYYHGFHLKRILQIGGDAFIQFEKFLTFPFLYSLKFVLFPLFVLAYLFKSVTRGRLIFAYLVFLWFLIPWLVLSTYKGELTDYYFLSNAFIALFVLAYLINRVLEFKKGILVIPVYACLFLFALVNVKNFFEFSHPVGLSEPRNEVQKAIREGKKIEFTEGDPKSYLYYMYNYQRK